MEFLTTALITVLLTTASAKPIVQSWHHDADIRNRGLLSGWLEQNALWSSESSQSVESSSLEDSIESVESKESRQSSESESSEESSEEIFTWQTTPPIRPTAAMTTRRDKSTLTPEPGTASTDGPNVEETTPLLVTVLIPGGVTDESPSVIPVTDNRGDN